MTIRRSSPVGTLPFKQVFVGFENVSAVRSIFGAGTDHVLSELQVDVEEGRGYMRINDKKRSVIVSSQYLRAGDRTYLYLDVVHELVHIRQHMEGKELWDRRYPYVDRPTEIEAYKLAVEEARRLGMNDKEIAAYLKVEWVSEEDFRRFLRTLDVEA